VYSGVAAEFPPPAFSFLHPLMIVNEIAKKPKAKEHRHGESRFFIPTKLTDELAGDNCIVENLGATAIHRRHLERALPFIT
jgi:hypothetical protein